MYLASFEFCLSSGTYNDTERNCYQYLDLGAERSVEDEEDGDSSCILCTWDDSQKLRKETGGNRDEELEMWKKSRPCKT